LAVRDGARRVSVGPLSEPDSIALVRAVTNGYRSEDAVGEVRELTQLCAQLPLALRIAAERAAGRPRMPLTELIQDLRDESALWDALSTDDDEEASAVRTVFAWSYRALPPGTARTFRLLGLHPGPEFSVEAAATLAACGIRDIRPVLHVLTGAHLLEETGRDRYQFHDLLRLYAIDQAHQDESETEQQAALRRILTWYLHSARAAVTEIEASARIDRVFLVPLEPDVTPLSFSGYEDALRWYESERSTLMAATQTAAENTFDAITWQLVATLAGIFGYRDVLGSWLPVQQVALVAARRVDDRQGEALVLETLGVQYRLLYRLEDATDCYSAALAAFQVTEDRAGKVRCLLGLGLIYRRQRRLAEARDGFEQALTVSRALGDHIQTAVLLRNLGGVHADLGHPLAAEGHFQQACRIFHDEGQLAEESVTLRYLGAVRLELHKLVEARESLTHSIAIARDQDDPTAEAATLLELSRLQLAEGSTEDCLASSQQSATMFRRLGHRGHEALALAVTGNAYVSLGRADDAVAFHRRTVAIQRDLDDHWQLAVALDRLAEALQMASQLAEAHESWRTSLTLIADYPGPRAEALRASILEHLRPTMS
jgi:tetratricopeptide (TPR) repeat protein